MGKNNYNYNFTFIYSLFFIFIFLIYALCLAKEINLTNSDLGRHLKNGELILTYKSIPKTNLYSYTYPDFPFYNHHWLSGVIFYLIHKISGFKGLSIFYIILSNITLYFFLKTTLLHSNFFITLTISLIAIPVISNRSEIRPEIFTYFFSSLYFLILTKFHDKEKSNKFIYLLPILQILWVNLHIYFVVGIFLTASFLIDEIFLYLRNKNNAVLGDKIKKLFTVLIFILLASLLNPYGYKGFLFPFKIFENYGYRVFENQSIWFVEKLFKYPPATNFKILLGLLVLSWIFVIFKTIIKKEKISFSLFIISFVFSLMACFAIRNFAIFGYFSLAVISINFKTLLSINQKVKSPLFFFFLFILTFLILYKVNPLAFPTKDTIKIGLTKNNHLPAQFFIENKLKGPIFNNYDIGSYLIYYLYPQEKVWTDNRPESYPDTFFKETYVPMQEDETIWKKIDKKYNFNIIFFYRHDVTPWAQNFLIKRVFDKNWAAIFVDSNTIILIKRNKENQNIIKHFELPKEIFSVVKN